MDEKRLRELSGLKEEVLTEGISSFEWFFRFSPKRKSANAVEVPEAVINAILRDAKKVFGEALKSDFNKAESLTIQATTLVGIAKGLERGGLTAGFIRGITADFAGTKFPREFIQFVEELKKK